MATDMKVAADIAGVRESRLSGSTARRMSVHSEGEIIVLPGAGGKLEDNIWGNDARLHAPPLSDLVG